MLRPATLKDRRIVAESAYPSEHGNLILPPKEALRHLHVFGPAGVGKSTLLARLILQDIAAGHGVVVVDPKGDLVDDVLTRVSPAGAALAASRRARPLFRGARRAQSTGWHDRTGRC